MESLYRILAINKSFHVSVSSTISLSYGVELWYNTKFHIDTQMTPFDALYGYVSTIPNRCIMEKL